MQKTYCDVCKGEIYKDGHSFEGESGDVVFSVRADVKGKETNEYGLGDLCLPCMIEAVDKRARAVLGRAYRKPQTRKRTKKVKGEEAQVLADAQVEAEAQEEDEEPVHDLNLEGALD